MQSFRIFVTLSICYIQVFLKVAEENYDDADERKRNKLEEMSDGRLNTFSLNKSAASTVSQANKHKAVMISLKGTYELSIKKFKQFFVSIKLKHLLKTVMDWNLLF